MSLPASKVRQGLDCSALIQLFLNFNNRFCPRDAKDQVKYFKRNIKLKTIKRLKPVNVKTGPWPGFATDCLPILIPVLTRILGQSKIKETIFTNRFMAVPELNRMGADIKIKKNFAVINGEKKLNSADCISSDLRTTFSIILGAIAAKGSSTISRIYHGLRGYSNLQLKLRKLGIKVKMKI